VTFAALPPELRDAIEQLVHAAPQQSLAARAARTSDAYRDGRGSDATIRDAGDVAAYLAARLPATYAAIAASLNAVAARAPGFFPQSLLDFGSGPGTASWAAAQAYPSLHTITMFDRSTALLKAAKELAQTAGNPALQNAQIMNGGLASLETAAAHHLVLAGYVFAELPEAELKQTAKRLWTLCSGILLIVEPGTPAGFERIRMIRETLLSQGGSIAAPCPGACVCPIASPDWCHFTVRLPRSRTHMRAKGADVPFEDEKFSYVAFAREHIALQPIQARILARPHVMKPGIRFKLCTAEGIVDRTITKRDTAYKTATRKDWGDDV